MQNPHTDARVVILGGGLTGISPPTTSARPWLLLEKEARLGGHARTDETRGFHFDKTGHWLHLRDPYTKELVARALARPDGAGRAQGAHLLARRADALSLPGATCTACRRRSSRECLHRVRARARRPARRRSRPKNFEDFCLKKFGARHLAHFMIPYNQKLWGVHPREITAEWCSRFVPIPKLEDVIKGAVGDVPPELGYNISFLYPAAGRHRDADARAGGAAAAAARCTLSTPRREARSARRAR